MVELKKHLVHKDDLVEVALFMLNELGKDLTLFVVADENILLGTLTDGDIRRGLLKNLNIRNSVGEFMNTRFKFLKEAEFSLEEVEQYKEQGVRLLPVVDAQTKIKRLINFTSQSTVLPIDVLIMAGGEGQRLRPLTETTPKPLLKVGSKPIIEHGIDRLITFGINNFHISIKYLGEQLVDYFGDGSSKNVNISYVREEQKLGTAGALALVDGFRNDTILMMNSDLLTNIDFEDIYRNFKKSGSDLMVACIPYKVDIPYAILEMEEDRVISLKEKPSYTYYSNAGIYLMKREVVDLIPKNEHFNATDLMDSLIESEKKVGYYSILGYWLDIGKMDDFIKAQEDIKHIKLS
jgi:dTDP-glucose pyrophosphorylase